MRIGDAAAAAGTTPRALRFYESRGLLSAPARTGTGQREYHPRDVARVRIIRQLLALGLTVEDVATLADGLHLFEGDALPTDHAPEHARTPQAAEVFAERIAFIDGQLARLTALRDKLAVCHTSLVGKPAPPGSDYAGSNANTG